MSFSTPSEKMQEMMQKFHESWDFGLLTAEGYVEICSAETPAVQEMRMANLPFYLMESEPEQRVFYARILCSNFFINKLFGHKHILYLRKYNLEKEVHAGMEMRIRGVLKEF